MLVDRRSILKTVLGTDEQSRLQFSDEFDGEGAALFKACAERGLEGIDFASQICKCSLTVRSSDKISE